MQYKQTVDQQLVQQVVPCIYQSVVELLFDAYVKYHESTETPYYLGVDELDQIEQDARNYRASLTLPDYGRMMLEERCNP